MTPPKLAYVVVDHRGEPCFSGETFERAADRAVALMRSSCEHDPMGVPGALYRIVRVEAE